MYNLILFKSILCSQVIFTFNIIKLKEIALCLLIKIIIFVNFRLEELHSLEYRRDADLFTDQEQRHMSQMQLHQSHQESSSNLKAKSSNISGKVKLIII